MADTRSVLTLLRDSLLPAEKRAEANIAARQNPWVGIQPSPAQSPPGADELFLQHVLENERKAAQEAAQSAPIPEADYRRLVPNR